jgi:hypothetical protein
VKQTWILVAIVGTATLGIAQTAPQAQPNTDGQASAPMSKPQADSSSAQKSEMAIPVTLSKSIDSKKAKAGDTIEARTAMQLNSANGQVPQGSKVIGHIMDAKAKGKGDSESSLSFAFDKIEVKKGQEIAFHAIAQAIAAPAEEGPMSAAYPGETPASAPTAGAPPSGHPGTAGTTAAPPSSASGNPGDTGASAQGGSTQLSQNSTGVIGIKGVNLTSQAGSSIISSDSKSVKLDGGTQILLRVVQQ